MIKIVFFGTPDIGVKSLEYLIKSDKIDVVGVVTQPDKPAGRGHKLTMSPIKKIAIANDIPVFQPKSIRKEPEIQEELKKLSPDFFVTFAFGQILSQDVLDIPKFETINLHASLLPKYRGANPIQRAIIDGEDETGICTMITELGLDCGDICMRLPIKISETMNCEELYEIISEKSPKMIEDTIVGLYDKTLKTTPQSDNFCMANKVAKEECTLDWTKSAKTLHNLVRGIYKSPCANFTYNDKFIKVMQTAVKDEKMPVGEFKQTKEGVEVGTGDGVLVLLKVKPEGKGEMFARDWFNGVKNAK